MNTIDIVIMIVTSAIDQIFAKAKQLLSTDDYEKLRQIVLMDINSLQAQVAADEATENAIIDSIK